MLYEYYNSVYEYGLLYLFSMGVVTVLIVGIIVILMMAWFWSLIHCVFNKDITDSNRVIGVVLIVSLNVLGSIIYLFLNRRSNLKVSKMMRLAPFFMCLICILLVTFIGVFVSKSHDEQSPNGGIELGQRYQLKEVRMNDLIHQLASLGGVDYLHDPVLDDSKYLVNGQMTVKENPIDSIRDLVVLYGLRIHVEGNDLKVYTENQYKELYPNNKIDQKVLPNP